MKVKWIDETDRSHTIQADALGSDSVEVAACTCGANRVAGTGKHIADDDRHYEARAVCISCGAHRGRLEVWPSTLFGLREDEQVFSMSVKVY